MTQDAENIKSGFNLFRWFRNKDNSDWDNTNKQAELESVINAIGKSQGVIEFAMDGTIITANENFLNPLGYTLDEVKGVHHSAFCEDSYANSDEYRSFWAKLNRGEFDTGEYKRIGKGGKEVWIQATYNPIMDLNGKLYKIVKFSTDVTEQKLKNVESQGKIDAIDKSQGVIEFAMDGTIIIANENFLNPLGYTLDEVKGVHHRVFCEESYANSGEYLAFWAKLNRGEFDTGEYKRIGKDGKEVWIQATYNPIMDLNGKPFKIVKFSTDVTEQKLKNVESQGKIDAIDKSQGVMEFEMDGTIITANENFLDSLGYTLDEVKGVHHRTFCEESYANSDEYRSFWAKLNRGEFDTGEYKRIGNGGKEIWIQATYNPIMDLNGKPYKIVKFAADITDKVVTNTRNDWLKTNYGIITKKLQGIKQMQEFANVILDTLAPLVGAQVGAFFLKEVNEAGSELVLTGSHAYTKRQNFSDRFKAREGLVGQCAFERKTILLTKVPESYITINSGLGEAPPKNIIVLPITFDGALLAVLELASLEEFSLSHRELMEQVAQGVGVIIKTIESNLKTEELLVDAKTKSEVLENQSNELKAINEEMEEQAKILRESQEELKNEQEELRATNEELEEKTKFLNLQKNEIEEKNKLVEESKKEVEEKAKNVEQASKYKSEFLANMSHELRTPLNSLLILAKNFADNTDGNLTEDQIEEAEIIYNGGNELLTLINDILDLSKVEAGKLDVIKEDVSLEAVAQSMKTQFSHVAEKNGLKYVVEVASGLPLVILTDGQRVQQVLKNFLSNAMKFTRDGSVSLKIFLADPAQGYLNENLTGEVVAFSVIDSGIGIPKEKQKAIFEAFQQADGSTNRNYGGTGLGLTISQRLARLMGGEIQVTSKEGEGSVFTLYLPLAIGKKIAENSRVSNNGGVEIKPAIIFKDENSLDDRATICPGDKTILIIEDDPKFVDIISKLSTKRGFKKLIAKDAQSGLELAFDKKPNAIILDLGLPDMDGLEVLDRLQQNRITKNIPVHVISGREAKEASIKKGALDFLAKPVGLDQLQEVFAQIELSVKNTIKEILIVEDEQNSQKVIKKLLEKKGVATIAVSSGEKACELLKEKKYNCMVLDLGLTDMNGLDLLRKIEADQSIIKPPVIVYTAKDLTTEENKELMNYASSVVIKGIHSSDRLVTETNLFLHSVESSLPMEQKKKLQVATKKNLSLEGKTVLLVDDDMRNTFALSKVLKKYDLKVILADNGQLALEKLEKEKSIDLVLMDLMMPVMDGYEAIKKIRTIEKYKELPVIALTAKAMKDDREKCLSVGANDYMPKPIDTEKLISLLKVWLYAKIE